MLTDEELKKLLTQLNTRDRLARKTIKGILVEQGESLVPQLISLLAGDDPTAFYSIEILGELGSPQAAPYLVRFLNRPDTKFQFSALGALAKLEQIGEVEAVIRLLASQDEFVKLRAIELLGSLQIKAAIQPLIQLMLEEGDYSSVKYTVVQALGSIKDERAVEPLLGQLDDDFVNTEVILALGNIAKLETLPAIISFLSHQATQLQYSSMLALGNFQGAVVEKAIINYLEREISDTPTYETGIKILAKVGTSRSFSILSQIASENIPLSSDPETSKRLRIAAIKTLGQIGDRSVLDFLQSLSTSQDDELRIIVEQTLNTYQIAI